MAYVENRTPERYFCSSKNREAVPREIFATGKNLLAGDSSQIKFCPGGVIGSRRRLKISRPQGHVGSTPTPGISEHGELATSKQTTLLAWVGSKGFFLELISKPIMATLFEAISHRRFRVFGKKQRILSRSSSLHLPRLRSFFFE